MCLRFAHGPGLGQVVCMHHIISSSSWAIDNLLGPATHFCFTDEQTGWHGSLKIRGKLGLNLNTTLNSFYMLDHGSKCHWSCIFCQRNKGKDFWLQQGFEDWGSEELSSYLGYIYSSASPKSRWNWWLVWFKKIELSFLFVFFFMERKNEEHEVHYTMKLPIETFSIVTRGSIRKDSC